MILILISSLSLSLTPFQEVVLDPRLPRRTAKGVEERRVWRERDERTKPRKEEKRKKRKLNLMVK